MRQIRSYRDSPRDIRASQLNVDDNTTGWERLFPIPMIDIHAWYWGPYRWRGRLCIIGLYEAMITFMPHHECRALRHAHCAQQTANCRYNDDRYTASPVRRLVADAAVTRQNDVSSILLITLYRWDNMLRVQYSVSIRLILQSWWRVGNMMPWIINLLYRWDAIFPTYATFYTVISCIFQW